MGKRKGKNRIYVAESDPDYGCAYIAAPNIKEAKRIALGTDVAEHAYSFIDLRVWWKRGAETDLYGELNIKQIIDLGFAWWYCPECENEDFEVLSGWETYRCKKCGHEDEIPYVY